ncbi:MAG: polymorphic toxin type 23 domain-containing protein [Bacteroidota bacterium]
MSQVLIRRSIGLFILCFFLKSSSVSAQWLEGQLGMQLGLSCNVGSKVDRIGILVGGYYYYDHFQLNIQSRLLYNFRAFGSETSGIEWQLSGGGILAFGPQDNLPKPFFHPLANATPYKHSLGYSFNSYRSGPSPQQTGSLSIQLGRFALITENDALAFGGKDRFRTGALQLAYQFSDDLRLNLNTSLWTGDQHHPEVRWIKEPGDYPCRYGYKDLSAAPLGKTSRGIFSLQLQGQLPYEQWLDARLGLDDERIRHWLQNRMIHDHLPEHWTGNKNPHLPMLDTEGQPYVFRPDQQLRPASFFANLGLNSPLFY